MVRGEHASGSPEEGVVRDDRVDGEAKPGQQTGGPLEPEVAVCDGTVGVTQVHELVLAERLHPGRIEARLMAEAMPEYLEAATAGRKPSRARWIERMACRGAQRHVGRREQLRPVLSACEPFQELDMHVVTAFEDADRAQQVGKRARIAAALEDRSRDDSWEVENRSTLIGSGRGDEIVDPANHFLECARAPVQAVDAHLDEEAACEQLRPEVGAHESLRPSATTTAAAMFPSWLRLTAKSFRKARLARSAAWPLSRSLGRPLSSWWTSIERQDGSRSLGPSAFIVASFAAKRAAR